MRPSWIEYFKAVMDAAALRATCDRGKSGCVIYKNNHILSTGYVGSLPGQPHCDDVGHKFVDEINLSTGETRKSCKRTVHAEANAIANAAKLGIALEGATLLCRMSPCKNCAELIIASGIKKVICEYKHESSYGEELLHLSGVEFILLKDYIIKYKEGNDGTKSNKI